MPRNIDMDAIGALLIEEEARFCDRLREARRRAAERGVEVVRAEAPVRTGFLRESVNAAHDDADSRIFVDAHYAPFVEYGTRYQAPNPFMRRSIPELMRILAEEEDRAAEYLRG